MQRGGVAARIHAFVLCAHEPCVPRQIGLNVAAGRGSVALQNRPDGLGAGSEQVQKMAGGGGVRFRVNVVRCANLRRRGLAAGNDFSAEEFFRGIFRELFLESFKRCAEKVTYSDLRYWFHSSCSLPLQRAHAAHIHNPSNPRVHRRRSELRFSPGVDHAELWRGSECGQTKPPRPFEGAVPV